MARDIRIGIIAIIRTMSRAKQGLICVAGRENAPAQIIDEVITLRQWHHQFLQLAKVAVKSATYSGYSQ